MKRKFVAIFLLLVFVVIVGAEGFWLLSPHLASRGLWPFSSPAPEKTASIPSISGLHVAGNRLLNKDQQAIVPVGVGRSGTEAPCAQGWGIFDGPHDEANVNIMTTWQINTVRVSLNEDCWLGINGVQSKYSGTNYRQSIINYVNLLNSRNILVIIDLHWSAPGKDKALGQKPMPDLDHSGDFWKSVATTFKSKTNHRPPVGSVGVMAVLRPVQLPAPMSNLPPLACNPSSIRYVQQEPPTLFCWMVCVGATI